MDVRDSLGKSGPGSAGPIHPTPIVGSARTYRFRMPAELDDLTIVQSAQHGDLEAFNQLVDRYQSLLFRIAVRMLGDEDNAADACQMAWIAAFRNLNTFRGGHFQSWLVRVMLNTCYDEIRRKHRRREVPLLPVTGDGEEAETGPWLADEAPGVEESVDSHEFERTIHEGLQTLLPVYRTMLVLVDIEGMSYEEAAAAARVPMGTVRSRLARARMAMRQYLEHSAEFRQAHARPDPMPHSETRLRAP